MVEFESELIDLIEKHKICTDNMVAIFERLKWFYYNHAFNECLKEKKKGVEHGTA